jgi:hypothetical protein
MKSSIPNISQFETTCETEPPKHQEKYFLPPTTGLKFPLEHNALILIIGAVLKRWNRRAERS